MWLLVLLVVAGLVTFAVRGWLVDREDQRAAVAVAEYERVREARRRAGRRLEEELGARAVRRRLRAAAAQDDATWGGGER